MLKRQNVEQHAPKNMDDDVTADLSPDMKRSLLDGEAELMMLEDLANPAQADADTCEDMAPATEDIAKKEAEPSENERSCETVPVDGVGKKPRGKPNSTGKTPKPLHRLPSDPRLATGTLAFI